MELLLTKPLTKAHSVIADVPRLEPSCLYIVAVDSQYRCPRIVLRVFCSAALKFRELSAPEASYFLTAQASASTAVDRDSFSSQGSHTDFPHHRDGVIDALPEHPADCHGLGYEYFERGESLPMPRLLQSCIAS